MPHLAALCNHVHASPKLPTDQQENEEEGSQNGELQDGPNHNAGRLRHRSGHYHIHTCHHLTNFRVKRSSNIYTCNHANEVLWTIVIATVHTSKMKIVMHRVTRTRVESCRRRKNRMCNSTTSAITSCADKPHPLSAMPFVVKVLFDTYHHKAAGNWTRDGPAVFGGDGGRIVS